MASFTDIIPKFNPYIQQLPVEAMVQVGMAKQQAYEQNVTKIQSQIDAIGGLDVTRGVDRKYLQSKIDQLGSKLATMASADFSNFQLVNAVGGMTSQIVKDDVIKTAVNSTAWARKQREKIEKGKSDGTWSIENEDFYNTQYSKWYNGTTAGEAFSSEYIPYRDVYKKLKDIAKDVGVEESLVQNLFNADGTVNKVMVETYSKGRDPNKIYEAFVNGIDQSDYRQLAITGRYKYKGYTNDQLIETLQASNTEYTELANNRKLDLQKNLNIIDKAIPTVKKEEEKKNLEEQRVKIVQAMSKIDEQVAESNKAFNESKTKLGTGDEEYANAIRSRIHTNKFLGTLSKDFADKTSYVKYAENPLWKAIMEEKKFALDSWYKKAQISVDWAKVAAQNRAAAAQEKANKIKEDELKTYSTPTGAGEGAKANKDNITKAYQDFVKQRDDNMRKLVLSSVFGNDPEAMRQHIENAKKQPVKEDKGSVQLMTGFGISNGKFGPQYKNERVTATRYKTEQEIINELGTQAYSQINTILNDKTGKYKSIATTIDRNTLFAVNNINIYNRRITGMKAQMENIAADAKTRAGIDDKQLEYIKSQLTPETITYYPGYMGARRSGKDPELLKTTVLSPQDLVDVGYIQYFGDKKGDFKVEQARARLNQKYSDQDIQGIIISMGKYKNRNDWSRGFGSMWDYTKSFFQAPTPGTQGAFYSAYSSMRDAKSTGMNRMFNEFDKARYLSQDEIENKMYEESFEGFFPKNLAFNMNDKNRDVVIDKMNSTLYNVPGFGENERNLLLDGGSRVFIRSTPGAAGFGGMTHEVVITGKDGKQSKPILISGEQYSTLAGKPPEADIDVVLGRARMNRSIDGSTNINGVGVVETAMFQGSDFPYVTQYNIGGADITRNYNDPNTYYPTIYLATKGSTDYKPYTIQADYTLDQAFAFPSLLTDARINTLLK